MNNIDTVEKYTTNSEEETLELGRKFAERLKAGDVVAIEGDLGSGKTEFIKGIGEYFNVEDTVNSPTFTIMNHYTGMLDDEEIDIFHIDLYRIENEKELAEIGFDECLHSPEYIKLIEWPNKAGDRINNLNYKIIINTDEDNEVRREIEILHLA